MKVNIRKLASSAIIPTYAHSGDSGADLYSIENYIIPPGDIMVIRTGLSAEIPLGYEGQIRSRSGLASKHAVVVINSPGTIDSGYTGEIKVALINHGFHYYKVNAGDRIAQLVIAPVVRAEFHEKATIDTESERGDGGFGSSGS
jgi:dUTP pyrophosphatase